MSSPVDPERLRSCESRGTVGRKPRRADPLRAGPIHYATRVPADERAPPVPHRPAGRGMRIRLVRNHRLRPAPRAPGSWAGDVDAVQQREPAAGGLLPGRGDQNRIGRPRPSTARWILVFNPPPTTREPAQPLTGHGLDGGDAADRRTDGTREPE